MIYSIVQELVDNKLWFNVVSVSTNETKDGFDNREDAERFMAHLEADDAIGVLEQERK